MNTRIDSHSRRALWLSIVLLASSIGFAACDDDPIEPGDPVEWAAELTGEPIEGTSAVTSNNVSFQAEIAIENGEEDAVFAWEIAEGTCTEPGDRIGGATEYPDLEVAADGTAEAEADVDVGLDEADEYIALVVDDSGDDPVIVACGALEVQE